MNTTDHWNDRRRVVALDANLVAVGELDVGPEPSFDQGSLLQRDDSYNGIRIRTTTRDALVSYSIDRRDQQIFFEEKSREPIADASITPELSLTRATQVALVEPSEFQNSRARETRFQRGLARTTGSGQVVLQDPKTKVVALFGADGSLLRSITVSGEEDDPRALAYGVWSTNAGGFAMRLENEQLSFDASGQLTRRDVCGSRSFDFGAGIWVLQVDGAYLLREGTNARVEVKRHADRRFINSTVCVVRDHDKHVLLDALDDRHLDDCAKHWHGRIGLFGLDGHPETCVDFELRPGASWIGLVDCTWPWALLQSSDGSEVAWLVRVDTGHASKLAWKVPGVVLGLESAGRELWRLEDDGRMLSKYTMPANDAR